MVDEKDMKKSDTFENEEKKQEAPNQFSSEKESKIEYASSGQGKPKKYKTYWRKLMDSTQRKMSMGAAKIARMISRARGDGWRRGGEGNREHRKPGKK